MNIKSNGDVSAIMLKHNGCQVCFMRGMPDECFITAIKTSQIKETETACFEFNDIIEINVLINALEMLREECINGIGTWRKTY